MLSYSNQKKDPSSACLPNDPPAWHPSTCAQCLRVHYRIVASPMYFGNAAAWVRSEGLPGSVNFRTVVKSVSTGTVYPQIWFSIEPSDRVPSGHAILVGVYKHV